MAADLVATWEFLGPAGNANHRFTSSSIPPTISLSELLDDSITLDAGGSTVTVWDASTSPLPTFDYLYLQAINADVLVELTITVAAVDQVQVLMLKADSLPFCLNDDTAFFTIAGTSGLITKVRVAPGATNTETATLRYGVGLA